MERFILGNIFFTRNQKRSNFYKSKRQSISSNIRGIDTRRKTCPSDFYNNERLQTVFKQPQCVFGGSTGLKLRTTCVLIIFY